MIKTLDRIKVIEENPNHWWIVLKRPFCNTQDNALEKKDAFKNKDLYVIKMQVPSSIMVQKCFLSSKLTKETLSQRKALL